MGFTEWVFRNLRANGELRKNGSLGSCDKRCVLDYEEMYDLLNRPDSKLAEALARRPPTLRRKRCGVCCGPEVSCALMYQGARYLR